MSEEIFINQSIITMQCEGPNIGIPCLLLRTSYCNLKCPFCDTKYSWKHPKDGITLTNENYRNLRPYNIHHLLLTGGEPLLYAKLNLFWKILKNWDSIDIEINGTLLDKSIIMQLCLLNANVNVIIGVKTNHNCYNTRYEFNSLIENLKHLNNQINVYLKFVYSTDEEKSIMKVISALKNINRKQIYIMPLTPNQKHYKTDGEFMVAMKKNNLETAKFCIENDLRMTPRLQYYLYPKGSKEEFDNFAII